LSRHGSTRFLHGRARGTPGVKKSCSCQVATRVQKIHCGAFTFPSKSAPRAGRQRCKPSAPRRRGHATRPAAIPALSWWRRRMSLSGIGADTSYLTYLPNTTADASSATPDFAADFETIDSNATGIITRTEFEQSFATLPWPDSLKAQGADAIFAQLD